MSQLSRLTLYLDKPLSIHFTHSPSWELRHCLASEIAENRKTLWCPHDPSQRKSGYENE